MKYLKRYWFECVVAILYITLFFILPSKTSCALKEGVVMFVKMLPVFLCVVLFSSFLSAFLSPKTVQRFMGRKTGVKGVLLGALFGTVIVGPLWILFPLYNTLLKKGARLAVIGAMIGAFAIKTPWIPYAAGFLGWPFISIIVILTIGYAVIEGYLMEKVLKGSSKNKLES
ncbi:MAG: hypothetical protein DRP50_00295 [Thermotoga sp.]|nr:MAG: hypothetical protein DRP50_00295 [Thermotoga sp.]